MEADSVSDPPPHLCCLEGPKGFAERLMVPVTINGGPVQMEVDTGAKASLIGTTFLTGIFQISLSAQQDF